MDKRVGKNMYQNVNSGNLWVLEVWVIFILFFVLLSISPMHMHYFGSQQQYCWEQIKQIKGNVKHQSTFFHDLVTIQEMQLNLLLSFHIFSVEDLWRQVLKVQNGALVNSRELLPMNEWSQRNWTVYREQFAPVWKQAQQHGRCFWVDCALHAPAHLGCWGLRAARGYPWTEGRT